MEVAVWIVVLVAIWIIILNYILCIDNYKRYCTDRFDTLIFLLLMSLNTMVGFLIFVWIFDV